MAVSLSKAQQLKGTNVIQAGIGLGKTGFASHGGTPLLVSAEHGFTNKISVAYTWVT